MIRHLALLLLGATPLRAQQTDARLAAAVERALPQVVEARHRIHQNPELGNREFKTSELVATYLKGLGLEVRTGVAHTGVVAILRGGKAGPVVAVRADMDALPITEDTPFPFRSSVRTTYLGQDVGVAHACGHDIHVAVELGVAAALASMRERMPGTVLFIFQPAEEGAPPGEEGGAKLMLEEGVFDNPRPSAVFGLHSVPTLAVGQIGFHSGPVMAASTGWDATIHGRQAHGAQPERSVDPIVVASQVVLGLQTIRSRNLSPFTPSVVTVGVLHAGDRRNIIPAMAQLSGTIRSFDPAVQDTIERRMREIFDGTTRAAGGGFELTFDEGYPVVVNDSALGARMRPSLVRAVGAENVVDPGQVMGGEDFAYYANTVPGMFFFLGTEKPGTISGGLHTPTFLGDDSAIPVGIRAMTSVLLDYLAAGK